MALQRRRARAVAVDDAARVYEVIKELATDVFPSGASGAIMSDHFFFRSSAHLRVEISSDTSNGLCWDTMPDSGRSA